MQKNQGKNLRPKPAGSNWTDEQWEAITYRGGNVLVAAGAGSGKTSILVERILQQITDRENPVEIDRLLVVTFTNAAAAEMKLRIGAALERALKENPRLSVLRRQLLLLNKASISTVHSFCLQVIRRYYYLRDLDPSFRILEETEADLLQQEVLEEVLETYYAEEETGSSFYRLVDIYSSDRGDRALFELVLRLYSFSRSHLEPDLWLQEQAAAFAVEDAGALERSPWAGETLLHCRQELAGIRGRLQEALALAQRPGGPEPYIGNLQEELAVLQRIEAAAQRSWAELAAAMQLKVFGRLKACSGERYSQPLKKSVQQRRDECKKEMQGLKDELFQRSLAEQAAELRVLAPLLQFLVGIVNSFARGYRRAKEERGVLDFADLEHYALQILSRPEQGRRDRLDRSRGDLSGDDLLPSEAALKYREQFVEVLVDEYQDINPVQEAILKLVSLPGPEPAGNRFMVGDVKQSIYRFRLAAPELFLEKYHAYAAGTQPGRCLVLRHNFRSRREILAGVNFLFHRIMDEVVGEMEYGQEARLRYGAVYYPEDGPTGKSGEEVAGSRPAGRPVEVLFITRTTVETGEVADDKIEPGESFALPDRYLEAGDDDGLQTGEDVSMSDSRAAAEEELDRAALEGRLMARRIKEILGADGREPFHVFDREKGRMRPATHRDIVILLRTAQNWAIPVMEELRRAGVPVYAELGTGYFDATEVEVMLSLLKVIDNPYQEIPLAAVLRSPLVGLNAEELALIRAAAPGANYYEALKACCTAETEQGHDDPSCLSVESDRYPEFNHDLPSLTGETDRVHDHDYGHGHEYEQNHGCAPSSLFARLSLFRRNLQRWQEEARQGSLAGLIWQIYRDTGYYDLAGGMPGGNQRQANLRALYDRARQYEATSLRGLFRFLRFIERLREQGGDLGVARALGEQEDVVRISTVHKGKGLEFPIVFVAGLSKQFNRQDLWHDFLLHKELGFGPKYIHAPLRLVYPTLPWLAIRNRLNLELLAEEMRILYVALTRAKEKLFLVATVGDIAKETSRWAVCSTSQEPLLPVYERHRARSFLDWLGPVLLQHPRAAALRALAREPGSVPHPAEAEDESGESSDWKIKIVTAAEVAAGLEGGDRKGVPQEQWLAEVARLARVSLGRGVWAGAIARQLTWRYPFPAAASSFAKVSVSELQRLFAAGMEGEDAREAPWLEPSPAGGPRPRFLEESKLTAAERGSAYHTVMQHLEFSPCPDEENVRRQLESMVERELLTMEEEETIDPASIVAFFHTSLGKRILRAARVEREIPFTLALPAAEVYPGRPGGAGPAGRSDDPFPDRSGSVFFDGLSGDLYSERAGSVPVAGSPDTHSSGAEPVLIQGVIDCLAWEEDGLLLVDYKTDRTAGLALETLRERYRLQLEYYARALQAIRQEKITGKYLYFFHGRLVVALDE